MYLVCWPRRNGRLDDSLIPVDRIPDDSTRLYLAGRVMFVEIKQSALAEAEQKIISGSHSQKLNWPSSLSLSILPVTAYPQFSPSVSSSSRNYSRLVSLSVQLRSGKESEGKRKREREVHEPLCSTELPNSLCRWWNNGPFGMHVLLFQYPAKPAAAQFSPHVFTCFEQLIFMPSSHPLFLLTNALSTAAVSHLPADRLSHAVSWASFRIRA